MINQRIHPDQVLDRPALRGLLELNDRAISLEIREGRLSCHWRLNRQWFLGADVLEWIRSGKQHRGLSDYEDETE